MKRVTLGRMIRIVCFLMIFVAVGSEIQSILGYKWSKDREHLYDRYRDYEDEPADSIDVFYLGTSRINGGVNPTIMFHETGMTGFNFSKTVNSALSAYFDLRYALKHQKPELVVIDLADIHLDRMPAEGNEALISFERAVRNMPDWQIYWEMIWASQFEFGYDGTIEYVFPMLKYHERWKELTKDDFMVDMYASPDYEDFLKGAYMQTATEDLSDMPLYDPEHEPVEAVEASVRYWDKILALCRENDIDILAVIPPHLGVFSSYHTLAVDYCEKNGIPLMYYPTIESFEEIGIDASTCFYNAGHLNVLGQLRFSRMLAKVVSEEYSLPDHRGDPDFAQWTQAYEAYYQHYGHSIGAPEP